MECEYEVERINPNGKPTLHAYFDLCPESPDGEHFCYFEFDDAVPGPGQIGAAAGDGTGHRRLGPVIVGTANTAARQQWTDNRTVAYGFGGPDGCGSLLVDIHSGDTRRVPGVLRMASTDGKFGVTSSQELVRKYGIRDNDEAVCRMDLQAGTQQRLFGRDDVLALHPMRGVMAEDEIDYLWFKHTKISTKGDRFFVVFTNEAVRRDRLGKDNALKTPRVKSLFAANVDGSDLHYVGEFGHHPFWNGEGTEIWAAEGMEGGQRFVAYDPDSGARRTIVERVHATHTALNPKRPLFAMDVLNHPRQGRAQLQTLDLDTGQQSVVAEFDAPDTSQTTGCHPHPVWSRDGRTIYFNVCEEPGRHCLCRVRPT